ncbi:MAG: hypothetical protein AAFO07_11465 [Bacteroidota bacterium]
MYIKPTVGSVVWFPTWDDDFPKEACQMRANSFPEALTAFKKVMQDLYYIASPYEE